jgi:hypothetical protein
MTYLLLSKNKEMINKVSLSIFIYFVLFFKSLSASAVDSSSDSALEITAQAESKKDDYMYEKENLTSEEEYMIEGDGSFPSLFIDWGFSVCGVNKNKELNTGFWSSRFLDFSFCYNLVIPDSHFAIGVGMGYSNRTLSFKKFNKQYYTLTRNKKNRYTELVSAENALTTEDDQDSEYVPSLKGSYLNLHYLDFIIDMRFFVNKLYPKDSFIFSIGAKVGTLIGHNTEIEYAQDSTTKSQKINDKFNLKDVHWGFQARAAWGRFGVLYEFLIPDLFSRYNGPKIGFMQKFGLAIDLF